MEYINFQNIFSRMLRNLDVFGCITGGNYGGSCIANAECC